MSKLFKYKDFIVDVEAERLHRSDGGGSTTFSFKEMWCYIGRRSSQKKPIRWCEEKNCVTYWQSGQWNTWSPELQDAINKLFHTCVDGELLED